MTTPERDPEVRLTRLCDGCKQIDDHPHHTDTDAQGVTLSMHMDCCRDLRGCPVCQVVLERANGAKGDELKAAIVSEGVGVGVVDELRALLQTEEV